ncbi:MAG: caspase family protein [Dehalococcoidales bacterium]|nr:caspase family protein [Dehalococcoidales bacterium]
MKKLFGKISFLILMVLLATTFIMPCAVAQAAAGDPECWAVIVGINENQSGTRNWHFGIEDAQAFNDAISPTWGSDHIRLLTGTEATKAAILQSVGWLASNAGADDTVLFYFSGWDDDVLYPYDYNAAGSEITAAQLGTAFNAVTAQKAVFVFGGWEANVMRSALMANGRVIMFAAEETGAVWYSNTNQSHIFNKYITAALDNFNDADANSDYQLTAEEIFYYAADLTTQDHISQVPVMVDNYTGGLAIMAKFIFDTNMILPAGATIVTIDGTNYTSIPSPFLWVPGGNHTVTVPGEISGDTGTRYVFTGWNGGATVPTQTFSYGQHTANFEKQYLLTVNSTYGNPTGQGWYTAGSTASFSITNYIETSDTKRYFGGWSGDVTGSTTSGSLVMNAPKTITASWDSEYLLTINSEYGTPTGAGWYNAGQTANVAVAESEGFMIKNVFDGWTGDLNTATASTSIVMNGPKVITATWHSDYMMLIIIIVVVVVVIGVVITLVLIRRKGGTPGVPPTAMAPAGTPPMGSAPPASTPPPAAGPPPVPPPPPPPPAA